MLKNDYLVAKIGVDTFENEPYVKSDVSNSRTGGSADPVRKGRKVHPLRREKGLELRLDERAVVREELLWSLLLNEFLFQV